MPDATGLKGLLMTGRSMMGMPKKGADINLAAPEKKKKSFMDRFVPKDDNTQKAMDQLRKLATKK